MIDDGWKDAIPEDAPPFFIRVDYDERHGVDVVGRDGVGGLFCIDDDEHNRSVWWVSEAEPGLPRRFVNSSVERFRDSMTVFSGTWSSLRGLPDEQARRRVSALRRDLAAIEAAPGVDVEPDDYWHVIFEQLEKRLL